MLFEHSKTYVGQSECSRHTKLMAIHDKRAMELG